MLYLVIRLSDYKVIAVTELRDLADMIAEQFPIPCGVYNQNVRFASKPTLNDYFNFPMKTLDKPNEM